MKAIKSFQKNQEVHTSDEDDFFETECVEEFNTAFIMPEYSSITIGSFVLISLEDELTKKMGYFVGEILKTEEDIVVSFLRKSTKMSNTCFYYPHVKE